MMAKQDVISNGPSGRALKFLNNKNNLADLYLKKKLAQFDREKTFSVSHIDRDKFDTVDILKQIQQCDSDLLPASQRYLEKDRRESSIVNHRLQIQKKFLHPKTAPGAISQRNENQNDNAENQNDEKDTLTVPQVSQKSPRVVLGTSNKTPRSRRSVDKQSENTRQSLTLPLLESRQSIYLQVASFSKNPDDYSIASEEETDSDENTPRERSRRMSSRRKSFMAWVEGNKTASGSILPDSIREARIGKQERRRNSFFNWLEKRNATKFHLTMVDESIENSCGDEKQEQSTSNSTENKLSGPPGRFKKVGNNVISTLLYMKQKPLDVRLLNFYEKLDEMKLQQEKYYTGPSWEEQRRRWTLLTKGVKAALVQSTDDDDNDGL